MTTWGCALYSQMCACSAAQTHTHARTHMHARTHTHARMHTHTHARTHTLRIVDKQPVLFRVSSIFACHLLEINVCWCGVNGFYWLKFGIFCTVYCSYILDRYQLFWPDWTGSWYLFCFLDSTTDTLLIPISTASESVFLWPLGGGDMHRLRDGWRFWGGVCRGWV